MQGASPLPRKLLQNGAGGKRGVPQRAGKLPGQLAVQLCAVAHKRDADALQPCSQRGVEPRNLHGHQTVYGTATEAQLERRSHRGTGGSGAGLAPGSDHTWGRRRCCCSLAD